MSERFSTNFVDLSPPEAVHLTSGSGEETRAEMAASVEQEVGGFTDSFVQGSEELQASEGPLPEPEPSGSAEEPSTQTSMINPFADAFAESSDALLAANPFETKDSPTSSQADLSQDGSQASQHSGAGSPGKTQPQGSTAEPQGTAAQPQVITVAVEVSEPQADDAGPRHDETNGKDPDLEKAKVNGVSGSEEPGTAEITPATRTAEKWEKFEDTSGAVSAKSVQKRLSQERDDHGAVCAADAVVSAQWTALGDSRHDVIEETYDPQQNLPFRKTQSMRATTHRKVQIVDALRQRRLSNSSLDRHPLGQSAQFDNEDEITRQFNIIRDWQVFVKMERRVKGTRTKWLPVNLSIKDGVLVIKRSAPPTMPAISSATAVAPDALPLHEIRLLHNHVLTTPVSRRYDRKTKLHQIKLQQSHIHERRTFRRWFYVDHISSLRTIVKIGCPDLNVVDSLTDQVNEAIRQLPVTRQQGVAYRMNEVFVDVKDQSEILMNCDGAVLERSSLNRIYLQAFLSGSPECRLVLNDIEAILLQGKGQMTTSMTRQVKLTNVVLHPCVDTDVYKSSREITFHPVDGYSFELLRCCIEPYVSPPVNVSALMMLNEDRNMVTITASFSVRKKLNIRLRPIDNLVIKFPIASSWSTLFLADTRFGGKKSVRSTAALRGSFRRKVRSGACHIETEMGSAKYEPEQGAIMWRIGHYTRSTIPHTFRCEVQLRAGEFAPRELQLLASVVLVCTQCLLPQITSGSLSTLSNVAVKCCG